MYGNIRVTLEEEEEMIAKIARKIHEHDMDLAAILMFESFKPVSFLGANMGRIFVSPVLPFFGESVGAGGEKLMQVFEKHENVEKLIKAIEELKKEKDEKMKAERARTQEENSKERGEKSVKKGWRRFLPLWSLSVLCMS